ncbi:MAG: ABC transporter ATP-binding protein [Candidatus Methanomethyliaceae archaeon]
MAKDFLLGVMNIVAGYGAIEVLRSVELYVGKGEIVTVIGPNGAGKTTLLRTISGIVRLRSGGIAFRGERIDNLPPYKIASRGIAHVPEGRQIFGKLTVLENLRIGAYCRRNKEISQSIEKIFELFPALKERKYQLGGSLSGGEQQMLAIGRALMAEPCMMLMDEPSLGLAPMVVEALFRTIRSINEAGIAILLVEQNARQALLVAKRGYCLENGRIVLEGDCTALAEDPMIRQVYLGYG